MTSFSLFTAYNSWDTHALFCSRKQVRIHHTHLAALSLRHHGHIDELVDEVHLLVSHAPHCCCHCCVCFCLSFFSADSSSSFFLGSSVVTVKVLSISVLFDSFLFRPRVFSALLRVDSFLPMRCFSHFMPAETHALDFSGGPIASCCVMRYHLVFCFSSCHIMSCIGTAVTFCHITHTHRFLCAEILLYQRCDVRRKPWCHTPHVNVTSKLIVDAQRVFRVGSAFG